MKDCEQTLIAAWISGDNREHIKEFNDFTYFPELFETLKKMDIDSINILTVAKAAKVKTYQIAKLTADYLPTTYDECYKQKKEEKIRSMLLSIDVNDLNKSVSEIVAEMESLHSTKIKAPTNLCEAYKEELEKRKTVEPMKYGIPSLDYVTGGIRRQELSVIAARPSIGKTALALQIAFTLALKHKKVLFFPLEMAGFQLMERMACRQTTVSPDKLKNPKRIDEQEQAQLNHFFDAYKEMLENDLIIIEKVKTLAEIKKHIEHYSPDVVFIDQLSQMRENKKFNSIREQYSYMTNNLKEMTMSMDVPIFLMAQINRNGSATEPTLIDLKETGSIEEDADNVIMLHQEGESYSNTTPITLIVRKQRNGARDFRIECKFFNAKYDFKEIKK